MQINLKLITLPFPEGETPIPLEALIAFQPILVALLIPVAIMVFEQRKRNDLPDWLTTVLLKKCAKPNIILASTLFSSIPLLTYNVAPYASLFVFTASSCVFLYRMHSIYSWYKESVSHPDLDSSQSIEKYITSYLRDVMQSNSKDVVYTWRETWRSLFARHTLTPSLLDIFLETLRNSSDENFDNLVRTIDAKILTGKIPIYDKSTMDKLCSIAIYSLSRRTRGVYAYSNILQMLVRRSIKDERFDFVVNQLDDQLRDTTDNAHRTNNSDLASVITREMSHSSIDKINRIEFTVWNIMYLHGKADTVSASICKAFLDQLKVLFNQTASQLEALSLDEHVAAQYTDRLLAIESVMFNDSIDIEQLNIALSLEREIIIAGPSDVERVVDSWLSKPHPYIQHHSVVWTGILNPNDVTDASPEQLHNLFVDKENKVHTATAEIVRAIAPIFASNTMAIEECTKKHKVKLSSANLSNDTLFKLMDLLSQLDNQGENKEADHDDTAI